MTAASLVNPLFAQLAEPFTGEELFDRLADVVFFIKNRRGEYVVVNRTLVERCGLHEKNELLGRRPDELFPGPLVHAYRLQDEAVLRDGRAILNQLEIHFHASGARGWCLTNKLPLRDRAGQIAGLAGFSRDLRAANERSQDYASIARVVHHIQANPNDTLRLNPLASRAGLSPYQLEERFRRIFQLTVGQFIQKTRLEVAMNRLRESTTSIAEIAQECGYSDQSAFTRQFRQTTGLTPSAYRATAA